MAGDIRAKERAIVTLTSSGASLTNGSAGVANGTADLDARSTGNVPDDLRVRFELTCQWATITGITAGLVVAELYLVPLLDGTNLPDIDTTAGSSRLPYSCMVTEFEVPKAPVANTNMRLISRPVDIDPFLYRPYLKNVSGQTKSANWTLRAVGVQGQYT